MHRLIFLVSSRVAWEKTDDEVPDEDHFLGGGGASPPPPSPPPSAAKVRKEKTALSPPGSPQTEDGDGDSRHIRKTVSEIFPQGSRRWVDVHFLVFFAALLVVWIYVGIFGFTHGDMARLTHPTVGFLFGFRFSPSRVSRRTFFCHVQGFRRRNLRLRRAGGEGQLAVLQHPVLQPVPRGQRVPHQADLRGKVPGDQHVAAAGAGGREEREGDRGGYEALLRNGQAAPPSATQNHRGKKLRKRKTNLNCVIFLHSSSCAPHGCSSPPQSLAAACPWCSSRRTQRYTARRPRRCRSQGPPGRRRHTNNKKNNNARGPESLRLCRRSRRSTPRWSTGSRSRPSTTPGRQSGRQIGTTAQSQKTCFLLPLR